MSASRSPLGRVVLAALVALLAVVTSGPGGAQSLAKVRIGWVGVAPEPFMPIFRQSLHERGWVEGKNLMIEERYPKDGDLAPIPGLVADLVKLRVDLIVTVGYTSTTAAQRATGTIPVVFVASDAVERGFVTSLARPGGNMTGVAGLASELNTKRLEVLRQAVPRITRVGVLHQPSAAQRKWAGEMESAARGLGLQVVPVEIAGPDDIDRAASVLVRERVNALVPLSSPLFRAEKERLVRLAAKLRLPAVFEDRTFVEAGGLMSYGPDRRDMYRRTAAQVDRILKGAKPAEIPVEQATTIELLLNEKTAKLLGVGFPQQLFNRADEVIR